MVSGPLVFNSWEALVFWGVFIWAFFPEIRLLARSVRAPSESQDAGTARLIFVVNSVTILTAFTASYLPWFKIPHPHVAFYVGLGLLIKGSLVRRWCWRVLGRYFTAAVTVSAGQPIVDRGPYRWVRHPSYTGGIVMLLGVGIALGNWVSVALLLIEPCFIYSYRVRVEEKALLATLGEPYRAYIARTKRFIPFVT
ncbi:MAG: isoprenylcysteine carboxylmethyltransferase family protein [Candidatus Eisenbacteria bacterium]